MRSAAVWTLALALGLLGPANASVMWVVENNSDQVYKVDITTLTATLVGPATVGVGFGGLGFAADGTLYCWNTATHGLFIVNQATGAFTAVGPGGQAWGCDTFDINPMTNEAIAWSVDGDLYDVNLAAGTTSFRVATTPNSLGIASAFAPDGRLYNLDGRLEVDDLNWVDTTTGVVTKISDNPGVFASNLGYNPDDGMLYAIEVLDPSYPLYRLDPTSGAVTFVGNISGFPNDPNQQITMATFERQPSELIPEPTTMALLSLAGLGILRRRRGR